MHLPSTAVLLVLASLAGCASVPDGSITPGPDGSLTATARAGSEQGALDDAAARAHATCRSTAQQDAITERRTRALGLPARTAEPAQQAAELARYASATAFPSLDATDDFEASVRFTCLPVPAAVPAR